MTLRGRVAGAASGRSRSSSRARCEAFPNVRFGGERGACRPQVGSSSLGGATLPGFASLEASVRRITYPAEGTAVDVGSVVSRPSRRDRHGHAMIDA